MALNTSKCNNLTPLRFKGLPDHRRPTLERRSFQLIDCPPSGINSNSNIIILFQQSYPDIVLLSSCVTVTPLVILAVAIATQTTLKLLSDSLILLID